MHDLSNWPPFCFKAVNQAYHIYHVSMTTCLNVYSMSGKLLSICDVPSYNYVDDSCMNTSASKFLTSYEYNQGILLLKCAGMLVYSQGRRKGGEARGL